MDKCVNSTGRHRWKLAGLDVVESKLVELKRCAVCGIERSKRYTGRRRRTWI